MWVWVLKDNKGRPMNMSYKKGSYSHASVFFNEADIQKAVDYFGGTYKYDKVWLDL